MDIHKQLTGLAARARQEHLPQADVAGAVIARLRREQEPVVARSVLAFALASLVVAAGIVVSCLAYTGESSDPLESFYQMSAVTAPWENS